jgi:hypothetical protein
MGKPSFTCLGLRFIVSSIHFSCCLIASLFSTNKPTSAFVHSSRIDAAYDLIHFPLALVLAGVHEDWIRYLMKSLN